ncbi:MAG: DMT family transporter [Hyphomonadaceae bacterium]|nr:DMT family transporter [Hyphomonadaceae bacterium]
MSASALPALLAIFSAITVAIANFTVKRGGDVLTARMIVSVAMGLTVVPLAPFVPLPPADLWLALLGAVAAHWVYQFAMIRALHRGDLSLVFPVMRGLAPMMTAILAMFVLDEHLSPLGVAGLISASSALLVFALPSGRDPTQLRMDRIALGWAVATSVGVGLYSVVDASVARQMPNPYTFIVWLFLLDWIGITVVTLYTRRGEVIARVRPQLKAAFWGGVAGTLSYGAAIIAFTLTDAALVTALRETSVVFAALLAWAFLKEGFGPRRTIAAAVLASGLVLLQVSG